MLYQHPNQAYLARKTLAMTHSFFKARLSQALNELSNRWHDADRWQEVGNPHFHRMLWEGTYRVDPFAQRISEQEPEQELDTRKRKSGRMKPPTTMTSTNFYGMW